MIKIDLLFRLMELAGSEASMAQMEDLFELLDEADLICYTNTGLSFAPDFEFLSEATWLKYLSALGEK